MATTRSAVRGCRSMAIAMLLGWPACLSAEPPDAVRSARPIAELLAMTPGELDAGVPVRVAGVVTLARHSLVVEDASGAIWVHQAQGFYGRDRVILGIGPDGTKQPLALGDAVEVEGIIDRGGFAPTITSAIVRIVGQGPLPRPKEADVTWLFHGGGNALRVEVGRPVPAIVQGCRDNGENWNLILDASDRKLVVKIDKTLLPERPDHLIDASVRIAGVTGAVRNSRGQLIAPVLVVADPRDIQVVDPPRSSPFDAPFMPLAEIGLYTPQPTSRRRISTEGVVTCQVPGRFCYLQDGVVGLRVDCPAAPALHPGDRVKVAGFVDVSHDIARLVEAVVEAVGAATEPTPLATTPDAIRDTLLSAMRTGRIAKPTNYSGVLVRFPATLVESKANDDGWILTLTSGKATLSAQLADPSADDLRRLHAVRVGSELAVTGVAQIETRGQLDVLPSDVGPETGAMHVLLRSADDVDVVRAPPVWTARFLGALAGILAAVAGVAIAVIAVLRREVARQTALAVAEAEARQASSLEYEVAIRERSRIAADLHDTLLQTMTGIGYQLQLCRSDIAAPPPTEAAEHLETAERLVGHASRQLRSTVWSLRSMPDLRQPLPEAVAAMLESLVGGQRVRLDLSTEGEPCRIHETVVRQLLLVVQEAVLNAMHHGGARSVAVRLAFAPDASALDITVADAGRGFVVGSQPGPAEGHFGLQGMRERIETLGGGLTIESQPGHGTSVRIHLDHPDRCPAETLSLEAHLEEQA